MYKRQDEHSLKIIEAHAKQENVTGSQLIREQIEVYAQRLERMDASKKLDADIDELIDANNNLIRAHNDNTLVFGELAKKNYFTFRFLFTTIGR